MQTDEARQHPRSAEVDRQPAPSEDLGEPCVVAGDDEVATEREVQPCTRGDAGDLGNDRLRQRVHREAHLADLAHVSEPMDLARDPTAQIRSGTELPARTGDHDDSILVGVVRDVFGGRGGFGRQHHGRLQRAIFAFRHATFDDQGARDPADEVLAHRFVAQELLGGTGHEVDIGHGSIFQGTQTLVEEAHRTEIHVKVELRR